MNAPKSGLNTDSDELHRAAFIDSNGREITITPEMIARACEQLERMLPCRTHQADLR